MKRGKLSDFSPDQELVWLDDDLYADWEEWAAEQDANREDTAKLLERAIGEALDHGVSHEQLFRLVNEEFRRGGPGEMTELIASVKVRQLWRPLGYREPPDAA